MDEQEWTKADPALIGTWATFHGVTTRAVFITAVSRGLNYYWSHEEVFPSFQVTPGVSAEEQGDSG